MTSFCFDELAKVPETVSALQRVLFVFVCNAKRFTIVFLFFSLSLSRQCFWTDWQKLFSNFSPIAALSACDQDWS